MFLGTICAYVSSSIFAKITVTGRLFARMSSMSPLEEVIPVWWVHGHVPTRVVQYQVVQSSTLLSPPCADLSNWSATKSQHPKTHGKTRWGFPMLSSICMFTPIGAKVSNLTSFQLAGSTMFNQQLGTVFSVGTREPSFHCSCWWKKFISWLKQIETPVHMANIRVSSDSSGWLGFTLSFHMIVDVKEIPVPCTSLQPTCHF